MGSSGTSTYKTTDSGDYTWSDTLSLSDIYDEANEAASEQLQDRIDAINEYYPSISDMVLDTVSSVSDVISGTDDYQASKTALEDATTAVSDMKTGENRISSLADAVATQAYKSLESSGPTSIEAEMYRQGEEELALGRSLSAEQIRQSQQAARAAYGARGLGASLSGAAAEILNRDAYGQARQDARRSFASYANNLREQNVIARKDQAAALAGQSGNLSANQSSIAGNRASLLTNISSGYTSINPYRYALATTYPYSSSVLSSITDTTNDAYSDATDTSSSVASFNANLLDSRYSTYLNNNASISAANMYSSASSNSSTLGLIGSIGSGAITGTAIAI